LVLLLGVQLVDYGRVRIAEGQPVRAFHEVQRRRDAVDLGVSVHVRGPQRRHALGPHGGQVGERVRVGVA
jgi:hypothetical protein